MNLEKPKGPPPIPEDAKRRMPQKPPPIPKAALERKPAVPPTPPAEAMRLHEVQESDVIEAFEVRGFEGLNVAATLEKKDERKGKKENHNEDSIIADPETGLVGVLDGLGGEGKGDLASKAAEHAIPEAYKEAAGRVAKMDSHDVANALIEQQLKKVGNPEARGPITDMVESMLVTDPKMGRKALALIESMRGANQAVVETTGKTTATVGFVHKAPDGSHWAVVANLGDSAAYKRRKNGEIVPLTQEDSLLNAMKNSGALTQEQLAKMKTEPEKKFPVPLTLDLVVAAGGGEKEYQEFQARGIKEMPISYRKLKASMVGALGGNVSEPSLAIRRLDPGDELILATDGLVDKFEDPQTEETNVAELAKTAQGKTSTEQLNALRQEAKRRKTYKVDDDVAIVSVGVK